MTKLSKFLIVISLLIVRPVVQGDELVYVFEDTVNDSIGSGFGITSLVGDVTGGKVVMDKETGACSVTWNAAEPGFGVPTQFKLYLFNANSPQTGMIALVANWSGGPQVTSLTFSTDKGDFPLLPEGLDWKDGDPISTTGSLNDDHYISGTYAATSGSSLYDQVDDAGELIGDDILDTDGDGIHDDCDLVIESDMRETVYLLGVNTWIPNSRETGPASEEGCTLADVIQLLETAASADHEIHGQYVQELVRNYKMLVKDGLITERQRYSLIRIIVKNKF